MTEEEKLAAGVLFCPADPALKAIKLRTHNLNVAYNITREDETERPPAPPSCAGMPAPSREGGFIQGPIAFHYGKQTRTSAPTFSGIPISP